MEGVPTGILLKKKRKSALEVVMTVLHTGGKFDKGSYKVFRSSWCRYSCVNALSTKLRNEVH